MLTIWPSTPISVNTSAIQGWSSTARKRCGHSRGTHFPPTLSTICRMRFTMESKMSFAVRTLMAIGVSWL